MATPELTRAEELQLRNRRAGLLIFQISWILVFVCLVVVNLQLRWSQAGWPPPGVAAPEALLPGLATAGLLLSAWLTRRATRAFRAGAVADFLRQWRISLGLGALFVLVIAREWLLIPEAGVYSDVFRLMTAFHALHALVIGFYMLRVTRGSRLAGGNFWPLEGAASLWYFVALAWLLFFAALYIF